MRSILIVAALITTQSFNAQPDRFVSNQFSDYYDWFHQRSQAAQLYTHHSTLYTFTQNTEVRQGPCTTAQVITQLPIAHGVQNIAYRDEYYLPEDEIDGYGDIWYHVQGKDASGRSFNGYIWGAQIARGWRSEDLDGDRRPEFIMLGISSRPRQNLQDIKAEIRIIQNGKLANQQQVPGLCIFEDCASSPLLRIFTTPQGFTIIETSTMTVGCWAGIEKAFFYCNGTQLQRVYHAEYTTKTQFANQAFVVNANNGAQLCQYSHEDENYMPVWACKTITTGSGRASVAMNTAPAQSSR